MELIWIALFAPLFGFLFLIAGAKFWSRKWTGWIACATILTSFLLFAHALYYQYEGKITLFDWIPTSGVNTSFSLLVDSLSLWMTLIVTGVGFLIHVYSIGYMEHDEDYVRYFAFLNFFVFAMLLLVLASSLLLMFVGWEGVGLASYLLIGYYYTRPAAAAAATKAFVVNRIGDFGFLLALLLSFVLFETTDIATINAKAPELFAVGAPVITLLTLLYFVGATGKSAQMPLHVWLPDAMEGPTPVSALIHAATMVTAGVYLVIRMHELFELAPLTLTIIGIVGGLTSLFAALCAIGQTDLKRVLAYSTLSQLGLMFLACGAGAYYAALFHLTTHAFVKALLFLTAGNVLHMMNGTNDMRNMGGLKEKMPWSNWLFLLGALAMAGIPPLSAFFSKDMILEEEWHEGLFALFTVGVLVSILTGFYLIRAYIFTFRGEARLDPKILKVVHEASKVMLSPLAVLAFLTVTGGLLGYAFGQQPVLETLMRKVNIDVENREVLSLEFLYSPQTILSIIAALVGVFFSAFLYTKYPERIFHAVKVLKEAFYIDELYDLVLVRPLETLSRWVGQTVEPAVFDGSLRQLSSGVKRSAAELQRMQSGQIRSYAAWMILGSCLLVAYLLAMK